MVSRTKFNLGRSTLLPTSSFRNMISCCSCFSRHKDESRTIAQQSSSAEWSMMSETEGNALVRSTNNATSNYSATSSPRVPMMQPDRRRASTISGTSRKTPPKGSPVSKTYYHGRMSRRRAEQILEASKSDGTFLVYESDTVAVDDEPHYVLSVVCEGQVFHIEVMRCTDGTYVPLDVPGSKSHKSVSKLVTYYTTKPLDLREFGHIKLTNGFST